MRDETRHWCTNRGLWVQDAQKSLSRWGTGGTAEGAVDRGTSVGGGEEVVCPWVSRLTKLRYDQHLFCPNPFPLFTSLPPLVEGPAGGNGPGSLFRKDRH